MGLIRRTILLLASVVLGFAATVVAQSGDNVLLVVNESSADSTRIAEHYARARGVPQAQVLRIKVDGAVDEIERAVFDAQIQAPIAEWIRRNSAQDRILFIVLTKGIPLRVKGTSGRGGTMASVDSELTLLYRKLTVVEPSLSGPLANPYFLGDASIAQAELFSHQAFDIYLVTRLDGYTLDDVLKLIDRGGGAGARGADSPGPESRLQRCGREWVAEGGRRLDDRQRPRRPRRPRDDQPRANRREERAGLLLVRLERPGHHLADVRIRLRARRNRRHVRQHGRADVQGATASLGDRTVDGQDEVLRRLATVTGGRPDSGGRTESVREPSGVISSAPKTATAAGVSQAAVAVRPRRAECPKLEV
jgi:hypothetical protein